MRSFWVWQTHAAWRLSPAAAGPGVWAGKSGLLCSNFVSFRALAPAVLWFPRKGACGGTRSQLREGWCLSLSCSRGRPLHNIIQHNSHLLSNYPCAKPGSYPEWTNTGTSSGDAWACRVTGVAGLQKWLPNLPSCFHTLVWSPHLWPTLGHQNTVEEMLCDFRELATRSLAPATCLSPNTRSKYSLLEPAVMLWEAGAQGDGPRPCHVLNCIPPQVLLLKS